MNSKIALVGAHRTGKSTLAEVFAGERDYTYQPISISSLQAEIGYDSANQSYDIATRIEIQEHLLKRVTEIISAAGLNTIFDRSPLDLVGYASIAINGSLTKSQGDWFKSYIGRCVRSTSDHLGLVTVVQPNIPLVHNPTSAACCQGMIQLLNLVYIGLVHREDLRSRVCVIPMEITDLHTRMALLSNAHSHLIGK